MPTSNANPHISTPSDLQTLIVQALNRYGDFAAGATAGELGPMFLNFANEVIEDIRVHPYWQGGDLNYYVALTDTRPIPDHILILGLLAKYALQQTSQKASIYVPQYNKMLSGYLFERLYGNAPLQMKPRDRQNADGSYGIKTT
jgi:hypothetical protein